MDRRPWTRGELDVLDDLVGCVSVTIARRLHNGWLQDRFQGARRHDGSGRDIHRIHEKDILDFIRNHLQEINLGKIDQTWFLDLASLRGREVRQAKSSPDAGGLL